MQGKVSMVMPCYNKEEYIGEMFDSIIAQDWDNIELILVNDGSTDGTRGVIASYEPKFRNRGYGVVIIDQENGGVCAAVKAGLEKISGAYVCVVDADDIIDSTYVSTMAGWLEENEGYDYCSCGYVHYTESGDKKEYGFVFLPEDDAEIFNVEDYLSGKTPWSTWAYMVRKDYFERCRIVETYITDTRGSHEPSFMIPLTSYGGKVKIFPLHLYHHHREVENSHSQHTTYEKMSRHIDEYIDLAVRAVNLLPDDVANRARKEELENICNFFRLHTNYALSKQYNKNEDSQLLINEIITLTNKHFSVIPLLSAEEINGREHGFLDASKAAFRGEKLKKSEIFNARIIGYGALGRLAARLLPQLKGTELEPTELWDVNGDGINILKPSFDTLRENDTVLIFPIGDIENELKLKLNDSSFCVLYCADIAHFIVHYLNNHIDNFTVKWFYQRINGVVNNT
jgi:glycosyltransferase involved in cell wall biosynthesis